MNLFSLTVAGSIMASAVWLLDRGLSRTMRPFWRRLWWMLVPIAFLLPLRLPLLPAPSVPRLEMPSRLSAWELPSMRDSASPAGSYASASPISPRPLTQRLPFITWLTGTLVYCGIVLIKSIRTHRQWAHRRLSTDPALLSLLEDCKREAKVSAPIGLLLTAHPPAILGWLRPRILLPAQPLPPETLRPILLHELAHFRALDIPLTWLFTLTTALHWFNPAAHLALGAWRRFREEAADAAVIYTLGEVDTYEDALLSTLQATATLPPAPATALGIRETHLNHLKHRITMLPLYPKQTSHVLLGTVVLGALLGGLTLRPIPLQAQETTPGAETAGALTQKVTKQMEEWLALSDADKAAQSYKATSAFFKRNVSEAQWIAALAKVRTPLGAVRSRTLFVAKEENTILPPSKVQKQYVIAQFNTVFEKGGAAIETVSFEKEGDAQWRASGYYIRPALPDSSSGK